MHLEERLSVSYTETHSLGFLSVADTGSSSGENKRWQNWQWPNGKAEAADFMVGSSNPGADYAAAAPPLACTHQESNRQPKILQLGALPFDWGRMWH